MKKEDIEQVLEAILETNVYHIIGWLYTNKESAVEVLAEHLGVKK